MVEYLTELKEGACACLENADRLLKDARTLLEKRSFLSCFLLAQLASEELAKGFKLIKKHSRNRRLSKQEWENLTRKKGAHINKLKLLQEVSDKWTAEATRGLRPELDYFQLLKRIAADLPWAGSVDRYRREMSEVHYNWRVKSLYVDYDWATKQWFDPLKKPIFDAIFLDENICNADIIKAKHLSEVLKAKIQNAR